MYLQLAAQVCVGFQRRLADVRCAEKFEREQAIEEYVRQEANQLAAQMFPMRHFPVVEEFVSLFDGTRHHRRPILAIVGGSNLGKSLLAGKILQRVGRSLGIEEFLEITVEGSDFLDLTGYDHRMHCGVVAVMAYLCV